MPNWNGIILTTKGKSLQSKVEAGQTKLNFTKMKLGDGIISSGQSLEDLDDLVGPKEIVGISTIQAQSSGLCKITGVITNSALDKGYYLKELGLFATDPDLGEVLYAITTDTSPDYLQAKGGATVVSEEFNINIAVSNTANVTATIDMTGLLTVSSANILFDHIIETHNAVKSSASTYGHSLASSATPLVAGTAAVGTDNGKFARENHVHPAQTSVTGSSGSCTGNAATATTATSATTLTTARTIALSGKVTGTATSFNGSANISIPVTAVTADDSDTVDGKHASDFAPAGYGLGGRAVPLSSVNLNTVYDSGFYWVRDNCTNLPIAGTGFHLIVQGGVFSGSTPLHFSQIAINYNTGVTYTRTCLSGTWSAWRKLVTDVDFTQSLSDNGWTKLPNGLIMQWVKSTSNTTITFPITFPKAVLSVSHAYEGTLTSTINAQYYAIRTLSNSGFTLHSAITGADVAGKYHWLAIGY